MGSLLSQSRGPSAFWRGPNGSSTRRPANGPSLFYITTLSFHSLSSRAEGHQNDASRETCPLLTRLARCIIAYHHSRLISTRRGVHAQSIYAHGGGWLSIFLESEGPVTLHVNVFLQKARPCRAAAKFDFEGAFRWDTAIGTIGCRCRHSCSCTRCGPVGSRIRRWVRCHSGTCRDNFVPRALGA